MVDETELGVLLVLERVVHLVAEAGAVVKDAGE